MYTNIYIEVLNETLFIIVENFNPPKYPAIYNQPIQHVHRLKITS